MAYLDQIAADDRAAEEIQYQRELDRAARGSGFIAAEISPFGEVLQEQVDPGYQDPALIAQQLKLEAAAQRYKGQQMYAALIKDGATPAEAIRLAGSDMFASNPSGMVNAVMRSQPRPSPIQRAVPGRVPPGVKAEEANIVARLSEKRRGLRGKQVAGMLMPLEEAERAALEQEIAGLEQSRVRLLSDPAFNPNVDQVGYARIRGGMESEPIARPAISPQVAAAPKELTADVAKEFLRLADGNKEKARKLAKDAGYVL